MGKAVEIEDISDGIVVLRHSSALFLVVADSRLDLVDHAHFMRKGFMRLPSGTSHGSSLLEHLVNLLQAQTLGLRDDEKGEQETQEKCTAPDKEHFDFQIRLRLVHHVGSDHGNNTVPEPVRSSGNGDTFRSDGQRVDLANNYPGSWAPGHGKSGDVEAGEDDKAKAPRI